MIATRVITLDEVLVATEQFWSACPTPPDDRLRLPLRVGVTLAGLGEIELGLGDRVAVRQGIGADVVARVTLDPDDWTALLAGETTVTDLFFAGRITTTEFESWRNEYAQFFTLIRLAQGRPWL